MNSYSAMKVAIVAIVLDRTQLVDNSSQTERCPSIRYGSGHRDVMWLSCFPALNDDQRDVNQRKNTEYQQAG